MTEIEREAASEISQEAVDKAFREEPRFKTWRKHVRDIYQTVAHMETTWPSLTSQYLPYVTKGADGRMEQTIIAGTATEGSEQNYLQLVTLMLPTTCDLEPYLPEPDSEIGGFGQAPSFLQMKVDLRMYHEGDVLRARYMPHNPNVIASSSSDGHIYLFDRTEIPRSKLPNSPPRPLLPLPISEEPDATAATGAKRAEWQQRFESFAKELDAQEKWDEKRGSSQHRLCLSGNEGPALALDWNVTAEGLLAAGSQSKVCVWQIGSLPKGTTETEAIYTAPISGTVTEVKWFSENPHCALACSKESTVLIDQRKDKKSKGGFLKVGGSSLDILPQSNNFIALGNAEGQVLIFDSRRPDVPQRTISAHKKGEVTSVAWCPHHPAIVASAADDCNVCIYDVVQDQHLFSHAGHTTCVSDLHWSPQQEFAGQLVTTDDSSLQVWRPRSCFFK